MKPSVVKKPHAKVKGRLVKKAKKLICFKNILKNYKEYVLMMSLRRMYYAYNNRVSKLCKKTKLSTKIFQKCLASQDPYILLALVRKKCPRKQNYLSSPNELLQRFSRYAKKPNIMMGTYIFYAQLMCFYVTQLVFLSRIKLVWL